MAPSSPGSSASRARAKRANWTSPSMPPANSPPLVRTTGLLPVGEPGGTGEVHNTKRQIVPKDRPPPSSTAWALSGPAKRRWLASCRPYGCGRAGSCSPGKAGALVDLMISKQGGHLSTTRFPHDSNIFRRNATDGVGPMWGPLPLEVPKHNPPRGMCTIMPASACVGAP